MHCLCEPWDMLLASIIGWSLWKARITKMSPASQRCQPMMGMSAVVISATKPTRALSRMQRYVPTIQSIREQCVDRTSESDLLFNLSNNCPQPRTQNLKPHQENGTVIVITTPHGSYRS